MKLQIQNQKEQRPCNLKFESTVLVQTQKFFPCNYEFCPLKGARRKDNPTVTASTSNVEIMVSHHYFLLKGTKACWRNG